MSYALASTPGFPVTSCNYRILPSKHPSPCKRLPPFFDDPMVRVYKWLLHVNAQPHLLAREFHTPMGAYSEDYGMHLFLLLATCTFCGGAIEQVVSHTHLIVLSAHL